MRKTASVCPVCLRPVPAVRIKRDGAYYLDKACPVHGPFSTALWRGSEDIDGWTGCLPEAGAEADLPCPTGCGLCEKHLRGTCCTLLEVSDRCNLRCKFCFAGDCQAEDPPLERVKGWIDDIVQKTGGTLLQLSGGEPTLRDDLPEIVAYAKKAGCPYVQLNTNGLRLAEDPGYAEALARAGLSFAFLQFDGVDDAVYQALRGKPLLAVKERAIQVCVENRVGVTLVPTLVPGVNTNQVGDILKYAIARTPAIRGVHFQPVSYFGRIPHPPTDGERYTLGELLDDIVSQTGGLVPRESLVPSACDHPLCGLHGDYIALPGGGLEALSQRSAKQESCCCCGPADPAEQNRNYIGQRWSRTDSVCCCQEEPDLQSLDGFLQWKRTHGLTITAMAFQDAGNLDFERLRQCSLHVYREGKRIPFCAAYLSGFGA